MKKLVILLAVLVPIFVIGQSQDENYIYSKTYRTEVVTPSNTDDVIEVISYHDGLGRGVQTNAIDAGGDLENHILPVTYDAAGRQVKSYLPYPDPVNGLDIQNTNTVISTQENYYQGKYASDFSSFSLGVNAYSETRFEKSPVNRPLEQAAPGQDWRLIDSSLSLISLGHTIKYDYQFNSYNDKVIRYDVEFDLNITGAINPKKPNLIYKEYYKPGELSKNITKDENWTPAEGLGRTTETFTDKLGRTILKRTYATEIDALGVPTYLPHDTQYVYDEFGNLSFVLSPKGSEAKTADAVGYTDFTLNIPLEDIYAPNNPTPLDPIGAQGSVTVSLANTDQLTVNFNIITTQQGYLKTGAIMILPNALQDVVLGNLTIGTLTYEVAIESEFLTITNLGSAQDLLAGISINGSITNTVPSEEIISISNSILNKLCYQYTYDYRNRLIRKRIPGKKWEEIVYDYLDRPVLTQDPNLKNRGIWLFTKYDDFNRVIYTGFYNTTQTRNQLQNVLDAETLNNEEATTTINTFGGTDLYYTNTVFPNDAAAMEVLTVNYYDDYRYNPILVLNPGSFVFSNQQVTDLTKNITTGNEVKVLGTDKWIRTVTYYDSKARPICVSSRNEYLDTGDNVKSQYDFIGNVLTVVSIHSKTQEVCIDPTSCTSHVNLIITRDEFTYDHQNRLKTQVQSIIDGAGNPIQSPELIVNNSYDELGLLVQKKVGGAVTSITALQDVDYTYNVRGWLTKINDPAQSLTNDVFTFQINYNTITLNGSGESRLNTETLYNGNISETLWKTATDDKLRGYGYLYDELNRINSARYKAGANFTQEKKFYDLKTVDYDKNGNIVKLRRRAPLADFTGHEIIDKLNYKYFNNSNQLKKVNDNASSVNTDGFTDVNLTGVNDYAYDDNGNLSQDVNKNITAIEYNYLNLPTKVVFSETGNTVPGNGDNAIEYVYTATGIKMEKRTITYGNVISGNATEYAGNYIYERQISDISATPIPSILQFFNHAEGYVQPTDDAANPFEYVYQFKDHLGNIRLSYSDADLDGVVDVARESGLGGTIDVDGDGDNASEIIEENNYYPFGLEHKGYNNVVNGTEHQYKYNGKEHQEELGLNWYDYQARNYDPALGRWMNIDPLAETSRRWSPYNYVYNNPLRFIDPDGMQADDVIITGDKSKQAFKQLNQSTSLDLSMDDSGNVTAQGNAVTQADQDLLTAINDHTVVVNVEATKDNYTAGGNWFVGGAFGGSTVDANGVTQVTQTVNPKHTKTIDKFYGSDKGVSVLHEVLEGYFGGANARGNGSPTFADVAAGNAVAQGYLNAHNAADTSDPRHIAPTISQDPTSGHLYINKSVPNAISPLLPPTNVEKKINNLKHKR